ncbi:MAG: bacteriohemerythrin [Pseudomonadota bacterium]
MPITWETDLNTGIEVIDKQHMRIVDYINQLEEANTQQDKKAIGEVLEACVDYTMSHFAFEENLQEEAGYKYCKPHKKVHDLFIRRINEYQDRFKMGEEVADELHGLLARWLISHIKQDDADYVEAVKENMVDIVHDRKKRNDTGWFQRFFK